MNLASILDLPSSANPRLIRADDTELLYEIAAGAAGSTASVIGNAVVPEGAPIQPPQAFVDTFQSPVDRRYLYWENKGITSINPAYLLAMAAIQDVGLPDLYAAGNAIANTNEILAGYTSYITGASDLAIDLSGGTSVAPTGQGLIDKATLISNGWTVTTN